jgi:hypothetical protein
LIINGLSINPMPSQIIILGMHRSGTSLAGQVLEALGFHFGPEDQAAAPKKDNPLGYWERKDVGLLNGRALAAQKATWEKVGKWQAGNLTPADREDFDRTARKIIAGYPEGKPWFMKDPRMCITLPLWEKHLEDPVYLFVYRDPVEIARSLWTRNHYTPKLVMALWERYLGDALNVTRGKKRVLLRYADLLEDPETTLSKLAAELRQLGTPPPCSVESAFKKIKVDRSLRHHQRDALKLEIPFTKSQELLNRQVQDGTAFDLNEPVDVSEANRRITGSQEIMVQGMTNGFTPADLETCTASSSNWSDAMESIEIVYLLHYHLKRAKTGAEAGADYVALTLFEWCQTLSQRNPLQSLHRKARRSLLDYLADPPVTLYRCIRRSPSTNQRWASELANTGKVLESLLEAYVLGKLTLQAGSADENEVLLQKALGAVQSSVVCLKQSLEKLPRPDDAARNHQEAVEKLRSWGLQLSARWPLGEARRKAVREFQSFRAENVKGVTWETRESERLELFLPILETAARKIANLLASCR